MKKIILLFTSLTIILTSCSKDDSAPQDENPSNTLIGVSGGEITSEDGILKLTIPPGALNEDIEIIIEKVSVGYPINDPNFVPIGDTYKLLPSGLEFNIPIDVYYNYSNLISNTEIDVIAALHWNESNNYETIGIQYSNSEFLKFNINNFSFFSLLDQRNCLYLPNPDNNQYQLFKFKWGIPTIKWYLEESIENSALTLDNVQFSLDLWDVETSSFIFERTYNLSEANIVFVEFYSEEALKIYRGSCGLDLPYKIGEITQGTLNGFMCPEGSISCDFTILASQDKISINLASDVIDANYYKYVISHEIGHALGIGHLNPDFDDVFPDCPPSGDTALMAKSCKIVSPSLHEWDLLALYEYYIPSNNNSDELAYYPFNDNVIDESGNGYDGVLNGATFVSDRFGNPNSALSFDDTGNKRVSLGTVLNPTNMPNITIAAWINLQTSLYNTGDGEHQSILGQGDGTSSSSHYPFWFQISASGSLAIKKNGPAVETGPNWYPDDNEWHFVVATVDGNQGKVYFDAVEVASGTTGTPGGTNYNLSIGNLGDTSGIFGNTFNGYIDDVRIYDRAISASEVIDLFN